ncbi:MAG TPA: hypothetical protein VHU40_18760 [Polyangia bacterium]|jgi:hypothetical protein|nr:hypothetical protein [Polyangia bacterium]
MTLRLSFFLGALTLLALAFAPRSAEAYPQFQFSSGTQRCAQCHYSPAGYGLLTSWGRDEGADTISRGGDGAFLHGIWTPPDWLALGGDFRAAAIRSDANGSGPAEVAVFPMQGDLYARAGFGESGLSIYVSGGVRGTTRPGSTAFSDRIESVISREHYLMWKPSATGAFVRAGRFYAPFGLRLAEHIFYVRSVTGFNLYEETYNVSGGYLAEDWELHVTGFTAPPDSLPLPLRSTAKGVGGAVYAEKRFESSAALALQARVASSKERTVIQGGAVGKLWLESARLLFMGELDLQRVTVGSFGVNQLVSYVGPTFFPVKGLMATLALERFQEDLSVAPTAHTAVDLQVTLFPWAHCEVILLGRYQMVGTGPAEGATGSLGMLQLHYYL